MPNEFDDYKAQVEQQEFIKEQGAEAYADGIANIIGSNMDPDKVLMMKEGIKAIFAGPPKVPLPSAVPFQPRRVRAPYFKFHAPNGSTFLFDWVYACTHASHVERCADETVTLWNGDKIYLTLGLAASRDLWSWIQEVRAAQAEFPGGDRV